MLVLGKLAVPRSNRMSRASKIVDRNVGGDKVPKCTGTLLRNRLSLSMGKKNKLSVSACEFGGAGRMAMSGQILENHSSLLPHGNKFQ